ncbi:MAG: tRNA (N6-threonylcarbamoyladenosine(37)-N6)-methyltransferase TrmO [Deltaproteobacteria bacterium]|nr:MAG: tRNA (N6-threonylcarbamoyladenosine(37)-N6)-methyltransferase TrmO [Deltaproteobacteria bacterium]
MPEEIVLVPIGVVRAPYRTRDEAPDQGFLVEGESTIEVFPEYERGLVGIEPGIFLDVVYWMDRADRGNLWNVRKGRGIFSTRGPDRPNPLGICSVEVISVDGRRIRVKYLDALDGSLVVDLKHSFFRSAEELRGRMRKRGDGEDGL